MSDDSVENPNMGTSEDASQYSSNLFSKLRKSGVPLQPHDSNKRGYQPSHLDKSRSSRFESVDQGSCSPHKNISRRDIIMMSENDLNSSLEEEKENL